MQHVSVDPSVIVQSSLALVMAITMTDAIKAGVEHAGSLNPGNGLYHRFIAMLIVIILVMSFAIYASKHKHMAPKLTVTPTPVTAMGGQ